MKPVEKLEEIPLDSFDLDRTTKIGTLANPAIRQELITFLKRNRNVFAWSHEDMPGIDPSVMVHIECITLLSTRPTKEESVCL